MNKHLFTELQQPEYCCHLMSPYTHPSILPDSNVLWFSHNQQGERQLDGRSGGGEHLQLITTYKQDKTVCFVIYIYMYKKIVFCSFNTSRLSFIPEILFTNDYYLSKSLWTCLQFYDIKICKNRNVNNPNLTNIFSTDYKYMYAPSPNTRYIFLHEIFLQN